jgi:hypothetical protein
VDRSRHRARRVAVILIHGLALAAGAASAQGPSVGAAGPSLAASGVEAPFSTLVGRWVRPDGGYVITIRSVDVRGKLDAGYANPNPLPFQTAEALRDGGALKLFFELRAGGYNGSTYKLAYDPASDQLKGVYYQAVAKQQFDVVFVRSK